MSQRFVITVKSASFMFHQGNQIGDTTRFFTRRLRISVTTLTVTSTNAAFAYRNRKLLGSSIERGRRGHSVSRWHFLFFGLKRAGGSAPAMPSPGSSRYPRQMARKIK
jgi:hypothetical protein